MRLLDALIIGSGVSYRLAQCCLAGSYGIIYFTLGSQVLIEFGDDGIHKFLVCIEALRGVIRQCIDSSLGIGNQSRTLLAVTLLGPVGCFGLLLCLVVEE